MAFCDGGHICHGDLVIDVGARHVDVAGKRVELTKTEFDLLVALAASPRRVVPRSRLLTDVWNLPEDWSADATLTEHIYRLRGKLPSARITTVRGVGYCFDPA